MFRRLAGVKRSNFEMIIKILIEVDKLNKSKRGRKNKFSIEDQLLRTLEYIREYRAYFHISKSYNTRLSNGLKTP